MFSMMFIISFLKLTTALIPINVAVIAKTDGRKHADTDDNPYLKLNINGNWREVIFPTMSGDQYTKHMSDWFEWPAHAFSGFNDLDDLNGIRIKNGGNDGWCYEDISVFVQDINGNWHAVAMHHEANDWIDGNSKSSYREQTISMNVDNWQQCLASGNIREIQVFALTDIMSDANSDDQAKIVIHANDGHDETITLDNLEGNDYQRHKSDWWKIDWSRHYRTIDITDIELQSGGSDGWNPARVMVLFKTSDDEYQVVALDRSIDWLDNESKESLTLTTCPLTYTDAIGFWEKFSDGNGGDGTVHTIEFEFTRSETDSLTTEEAMERFQSTSSSTTIGVEYGAEYAGLTASSKFEHTTTNTNSVAARSSVQTALSNMVSQSTTVTHTAAPPDNLGDEAYVIYVWNIFRKNTYGGGADMKSFTYFFSRGPCLDVLPNCVSSMYCVDENCLTCSTDDAVIDPTYANVRQECIPSAGRRSLRNGEHRRLIDEHNK